MSPELGHPFGAIYHSSDGEWFTNASSHGNNKGNHSGMKAWNSSIMVLESPGAFTGFLSG